MRSGQEGDKKKRKEDEGGRSDVARVSTVLVFAAGCRWWSGGPSGERTGRGGQITKPSGRCWTQY